MSSCMTRLLSLPHLIVCAEVIEEMIDGKPQTPGASPERREGVLQETGATEQVLAAPHAGRRSRAFLYRFPGAEGVTAFKAGLLALPWERQREQIISDGAYQACLAASPLPAGRTNKKTKSKRTKQIEFVRTAPLSLDRGVSRGCAPLLQPGPETRPPGPPLRDLPSTFSMAYPAVMPGLPRCQFYPGANSGPGPHRRPLAGGLRRCQPSATRPRPARPPFHPAPYTAPVVTPILALILPNYIFLRWAAAGLPPQPPEAFLPGGPRPSTRPWTPSAASLPMPMQPQFTPGSTTPTPLPIPWGTRPPLPLSAGRHAGRLQGNPRAPPRRSPSVGGRDPATSPPLFQSCCSSPLQLNLLQLEESSARWRGRTSAALPPMWAGGNSGDWEKDVRPGVPTSSLGEGNNSDANSSSSDMMDIFLQEDSRSGTGSATSGSMGSGSNGCGTSNSGTSNSG
ncbi:hypothetical protein CRUP_019067, partial [Coryphaenoides rupestris]